MIRVAIASVEAIFDWKAYLKDTFGYEIDDSWLVDGPLEEEEGENEEEPVSVSKQENAQTDDRVKADMDRKSEKSNLQVADADRNVIRKDIPAAGAANGEAWTDGISDGNRALEIVAEVPEKETVKKETVKKETSEKAAEAEDRTDEL